MGKLRVLSGTDVCRILREHGFAEVRQRGSHIVMQKMADGSTTTVPVPNHDELKRGTLPWHTPLHHSAVRHLQRGV